MLEFYRPPQRMLADRHLVHTRNHVRLRFNPDEVIAVGARFKKPGPSFSGADVELTVSHQPKEDLEPYERLLDAAMGGEASIFARQDSVEAAWRVVDPVLASPPPVEEYQPGTWGPPSANKILERGDRWHDPVVQGG
jgi:glucose-6-phosphate 1-dehydrogenase